MDTQVSDSKGFVTITAVRVRSFSKESAASLGSASDPLCGFAMGTDPLCGLLCKGSMS